MSKKLTILGAGAAPGLPSLCCGWHDCDPNNPKNRRTRGSSYLEFDGVRILIDTSPDIRCQLLDNNIRALDGVLYTHMHADHLLGIDYLREINRITGESINIFAGRFGNQTIKRMFPYMINDKYDKHDRYASSLVLHEFEKNMPFYLKGENGAEVKITPIELLKHSEESFGFVFNDGELVYISDFKEIAANGFEMIKKTPEVLVLPLTTILPQIKHAGLEEVLVVIDKIGAKRVIINHMAGECDYENIMSLTPKNVTPAYDNMIIEF